MKQKYFIPSTFRLLSSWVRMIKLVGVSAYHTFGDSANGHLGNSAADWAVPRPPPTVLITYRLSALDTHTDSSLCFIQCLFAPSYSTHLHITKICGSVAITLTVSAVLSPVPLSCCSFMLSILLLFMYCNHTPYMGNDNWKKLVIHYYIYQMLLFIYIFIYIFLLRNQPSFNAYLDNTH